MSKAVTCWFKVLSKSQNFSSWNKVREFLETAKQSFFFAKSVKKSVKRGVRVLRAQSARASRVSPQSRSLFSASFQTFCLSARAYLNTQKYGLFLQSRVFQSVLFSLYLWTHRGCFFPPTGRCSLTLCTFLLITSSLYSSFLRRV